MKNCRNFTKEKAFHVKFWISTALNIHHAKRKEDRALETKSKSTLVNLPKVKYEWAFGRNKVYSL